MSEAPSHSRGSPQGCPAESPLDGGHSPSASGPGGPAGSAGGLASLEALWAPDTRFRAELKPGREARKLPRVCGVAGGVREPRVHPTPAPAPGPSRQRGGAFPPGSIAQMGKLRLRGGGHPSGQALGAARPPPHPAWDRRELARTPPGGTQGPTAVVTPRSGVSGSSQGPPFPLPCPWV